MHNKEEQEPKIHDMHPVDLTETATATASPYLFAKDMIAIAIAAPIAVLSKLTISLFSQGT